ncbi:MAG: Hpt domain-containing protein [Candidatus Binataceae bacterium]
MNAKTVVQVDAELSDLIPGFLAHKRDDARLAQDAVKRGDYETLARLGHRMKGDGGGYGFDAITDFGAALEQAAQHKDATAACQCAERLAAYLDTLEVVYE